MHPGFESFSFQHLSVLLVFVIITIVLIAVGLKSIDRTKLWIGFSIALVAVGVMIFDLIWRLGTRTFNLLEDLPLFLCDVVVILLPLVIWNHNRMWLGILYFWAVGGTMQALITPDLEHGFPTFTFFRYFIMHAGIIVAVVYSIVVWKIRINRRDLLNAILYAQVYIVSIHLINLILGSNYSYTIRKPDNTSILDLMGSWPWYILFGELVMIILFILLLLPFGFSRQKAYFSSNE